MPVVLQPRVTLQRNFLALPRAYPGTFYHQFLPVKHHVAGLLSPAHATRRRVRLVARSHAPCHFVLDHRPDDFQARHARQLLDLWLQFLSQFLQRQW